MSPATPEVLNTVTPTADPDTTQSHDEAARGRLVRRIVLGCFTVFVALGLMGVFGYRQGTTTSEAHGLRVEVEHPAVTRGGLPASWQLLITTTDGTPLPGVVEVDSDPRWFALFDVNGIEPSPVEAEQDEDHLVWRFDTFGRDQLVVSLDVRTQPDARWGRDGRTTVRVGDEPPVEVTYRTWVSP